MSAPALELRGVVKRYGRKTALQGVNLSVPQGSIFGLVGSNGAGKTTLLSVVAGLARPQAGEVSIMGKGPFDPTLHAGRISILPQDAHPPPYARVGNLLHYYARLQGLSRPAATETVTEVLRWVNLSDRARAKARTLSHGMLRRFTIAQAFIGQPDLVLLDEPMSGLDPAEVANIRRLIRECRGRQTLIISSHLLSELEQVCDHVAFIEQGQTIRQDRMDHVTRQTRQLAYALSAEPPAARMAESLPHAKFEWDAEQQLLHVSYGEDPNQPEQDSAEINRRLLPIFLEEGIGVHEVRRGADLEKIYLAQRSK